MTGKRWWFFGACPKTGKVTMLAEASPKLGESHARVLAHLLADDTRLRITAYAPSGKAALSNPRLPAGDHVAYPRWVIYDSEDGSLWATLTGWLNQRQAKKISSSVATYLARPVELRGEHRGGSKKNPATARQLEPVVGETWHTYAGEQAQIKVVTPSAVVVYWIAGGNREWLDPREFAARFKAPVTRKPNPIPRGVDPRSIRTVGRGAKRLLIGCSKGSYQPRKGRCRVGTRAVNPSRSSAAKGRRLLEKLEVLSELRAQLSGADDPAEAFAVNARRRRMLQNPGRSASEYARGAKTFKKWHAFAPHHISRIKAPRRIPRTMVRLGELEALVYRSDKWAGGPDNPQGKRLLYEHTTQRPRPVLATDPDGRDFFIVGGKMRVTADGLVH